VALRVAAVVVGLVVLRDPVDGVSNGTSPAGGDAEVEVGEMRDAVISPAHLERKNGLEIFALQENGRAQTTGQARRRIEDPFLIALATLIGAIPPFLGPLIYMLFRPPEYLEDVRERELEIKAMEERLARRDLYCPVCRAEVSNEFLVCPVCTTKLKQACVNCKAPLEALWQVCPYCETSVEPVAVDFPTFEVRPPKRRRRSE
jgi:RNA polymerase subunit RPABC4/transcription elongation factor Spt4